MTSIRTHMAIAAALAATTLAAPAFAGERAPTNEERTGIERVLADGGFKTWGKIELDDGRWEIDDARHTDGKKYDVELDRQSFAVLKKDIDD